MQINTSLNDILPVVKGASSLDPSFFVERIAALETAGPHDLAVVFDDREGGVFAPVARERIEASKAGVVMMRSGVNIDRPAIIVDDPIESYQRLIAHVQSDAKSRSGIHPTAIIASGVQLGNNVTIGAYVVINADCRIGNGTIIDAHSTIGRDCRIGNGVHIFPRVTILDRCMIGDASIIHSGAVIGSDGYRYIVTKTGMQKIPQIGIVRIGKNVEIGANACVDRASFDETIIEDGVKIDNLVHIAHNVRVGAHTAIIAQTGIAGGATIGTGCQIGGQVGIKDHVAIGQGAKIVSKSAVLRDVAPGEVVAGIPAIAFGDWKRSIVSMSRLPQAIKVLKQVEELATQWSKKGFWGRLFFRPK